MKKDDWGVHQTHCCFKHSCKYGSKDCPVNLELIEQEYPCESCDYDERDSLKLFLGCFIRVSDPVIKIIDIKKSVKKWCLNQDCTNNKSGFNVKFEVCPYCGSKIDFKDLLNKTVYPTETNLNLLDEWEVVKIQKDEKLLIIKDDLKNRMDNEDYTAKIYTSNLSVIEYGTFLVDVFSEINNKDFRAEVIEEFEVSNRETILLLKQNFTKVNVEFGLISIPTNYFSDYKYDY